MPPTGTVIVESDIPAISGLALAVSRWPGAAVTLPNESHHEHYLIEAE